MGVVAGLISLLWRLVLVATLFLLAAEPCEVAVEVALLPVDRASHRQAALLVGMGILEAEVLVATRQWEAMASLHLRQLRREAVVVVEAAPAPLIPMVQAAEE